MSGEDYGRLLRRYRVSSGVSLRDAARMLGWTDVEYSDVERGKRVLTADQERDLCSEFEMRRRGLVPLLVCD